LEFRRVLFRSDKVTGNYLSEICGRCERLDNCGYDYPPRRFFAETGQTEEWKRTRKLISSSVIERRSPVKFEIVPNEIFQASLNREGPTNFEIYLYRYFKPTIVEAICRKYRVGQSEQGNTLFWLIDELQNPRTAQEIPYNFKTGKRSGGWYYPNKRQGFGEFERRICFFGQHLLTDGSQTIGIVEAPKTAIICSLLDEFSDFTFLATCAQGNLQKLL